MSPQISHSLQERLKFFLSYYYCCFLFEGVSNIETIFEGMQFKARMLKKSTKVLQNPKCCRWHFLSRSVTK